MYIHSIFLSFFTLVTWTWAAFEFDRSLYAIQWWQCLKGLVLSPFISSLTEIVHTVNTLDTSFPWYNIKDLSHHNSLNIIFIECFSRIVKLYWKCLTITLLCFCYKWNNQTNVQLTPCTNCNWLMLIPFKLHISLWDPITFYPLKCVCICSLKYCPCFITGFMFEKKANAGEKWIQYTCALHAIPAAKMNTNDTYCLTITNKRSSCAFNFQSSE